jgi:membrane protein implicated in regulation of membrane protease activity
MRTFGRYTLLQVPGWVVAAAVLIGLQRWLDFPGWIAAALLGAYVAKDFLLYPFLRRAYETGSNDGVAGLTGVVEQDLDPRGYVRIRGELWEAEAARGSRPIPKGSPVRVQSARGLKLIVTRG